MKVSAIIPTIGRPELLRAVRSVLAQTVEVDAVVVLDRPQLEAEVRERLRGLSYQLVVTSGAVRGGAARNLGVNRSEGEVIAFLDDDDEWQPQKTELQLEILREHPTAVVSSRAFLVGSEERIVPEVPFDGLGPISSYLLERATLKLKRNFIQSSTLMMSKEVASLTPWRPELRRHQDWALLVDLNRQGVKVLTHDLPLVRVHQGSLASISRSHDWKASEDWLVTYGQDADKRAQADFLCSVALRSAIEARELVPAMRILRRAVRMGPHAAAIVVGLSGARLSSDRAAQP